MDLHLHTIFSDGEITKESFSKIIGSQRIFSVTDHNSVQGSISFSKKYPDLTFILGTEITVDRAPDYLVYFQDFTLAKGIESELEKIRLEEEKTIKWCYHNLGFENWDEDLKNAFPKNQKVKNARVRDLASIIHLRSKKLVYDDGKFDFQDLKLAREQRNMFADKIGNPFNEKKAFEIAEKFCGTIVLAHPIHTAIKKCPKGETNYETLIRKLEKLIDDFSENGGQTIEWEYFSPLHLQKFDLSEDEIMNLRNFISEKSSENDFAFTIGSDSHTTDGYQSYLDWLSKNERIIKKNLPGWVIEK